MCRPCNVNICQWNRECFFIRHVEWNPRFIVMTIDEVTLDRPKIGTRYSVICCVSRLRLIMKFSAEIFAPYGRFPPQSGFLEFAVSNWQFCCTTSQREYDVFSQLSKQNFLRVDSSRISVWCEIDFESSRSPAKSESWNSPSLHCFAVLPTWQCCLYSHAWWIYEINRFRRLSQALVHQVIDRASLTMEYQFKYKHFRPILEHTFDNSFTKFNSSSWKWWSSRHGVDTL